MYMPYLSQNSAGFQKSKLTILQINPCGIDLNLVHVQARTQRGAMGAHALPKLWRGPLNCGLDTLIYCKTHILKQNIVKYTAS